jgi:putative nucleotidyltransferase with HDIG domain
MSAWLAALLERHLNISPERTVLAVHRAGVVSVATFFVLLTTFLVAFNDLFPNQNGITGLQIGDIARQDIHAPISLTYESEELTNQRRQAVAAAVQPVFSAPNPDVARRQSQLARQILDFIDNLRRDPFATPEQRLGDLGLITALTLDEATMQRILTIDDSMWQAIDEQIVTVLERVMRDEIREDDMFDMPTQVRLEVSVRFSNEDAAVITAIVSDLIRPNTFENPEETEAARQAAIASVQPEQRSFERGQIVVREGVRIEPADYEALNELGLLRSDDFSLQVVGRAFLATIITMAILGLYIARFRPVLFSGSPRILLLLANVFLITLTGARFLGVNGQIYVYPTAALALLFVSLIGPDIAVMGVLGLAVLVGLMSGNSLEITALVVAGGLIGIPTLRRTENFNSYFFAGVMIAVANIAVVALFNLGTPQSQSGSVLTLLVYSLINGILSAAAALVGLYVVTQLFNLPTSLKLLELSRPNHVLLQRLLREAPGTYQHSLQVANLCEQAANAIGANAELVHVSALYHDIGKMENPQFFVENQVNGINPHNTLNDPYRSAAIIIEHVTEGDQLARQHRLPARIRDFIMEHHGTTKVAYFYRKAVEQTGDESAVNIEEFTYPGPRPQTRETAILMLADSCESTVRAKRPNTKQAVADIVQEIIQAKLNESQLDEADLTLSDLKKIEDIFVDMLQGVFHPRITYPTAEPSATTTSTATATGIKAIEQPISIEESINAPIVDTPAPTPKEIEPVKVQPQQATEFLSVTLDDDESDAPLPQVPPLRRTGENRALNGKLDTLNDTLNKKPEEKETSDKS